MRPDDEAKILSLGLEVERSILAPPPDPEAQHVQSHYGSVISGSERFAQQNVR